MLILGLLGMFFDAAVVFVTSQTLLLRLALAILCPKTKSKEASGKKSYQKNISFVRSIADRNSKGPSFENRKFTLEIM